MKNKKLISVVLGTAALAAIVVLGVTAGRLVAGRQRELEQVQEGDVVTLIGEDGEERVSVDAISRASHTINNETLTRITARVPRIYKK